MIRTLILFIVITTSAFAWDPPINEEAKLKRADWVGRGMIIEKVFVEKISDGFLWKATLLVSETIKGEQSEKIEFHFEQDEGPIPSNLLVWRCPPRPTVIKGTFVRVFLHLRERNGEKRLFLNGHRMIEK